jgi:hypothetical protein
MKILSKLIKVRSTYTRERCCGGGGLALTPCILSDHHSIKINKHKRSKQALDGIY